MKVIEYFNDSKETFEREMTVEEIAEKEREFATYTANKEAQKQAEANRQAKRSAALAKLEALGLDEDDLKALGL